VVQLPKLALQQDEDLMVIVVSAAFPKLTKMFLKILTE
jgi:hypothetical protein